MTTLLHLTRGFAVPHEDEAALLKAVSQQPVATAIQANQRAFQLYMGGVLTAECGTALNHGVLVAGCASRFVMLVRPCSSLWAPAARSEVCRDEALGRAWEVPGCCWVAAQAASGGAWAS